MKNTPGYSFMSGAARPFSGWLCVPKSRFGSKPHAVVRVHGVTAVRVADRHQEHVQYLHAGATFSQSVRASNSYSIAA